MRTTTAVVDLPMKYLLHHPDNPRKDLGDLTELTESIRANGVYQNLTIVPANRNVEFYFQGGTADDLKEFIFETFGAGAFYVMIGNRRFEAAKAAGLEEIPCRIEVGLSQAEEVAIMLEENMQRNDLTILEQAYGFQQLIDLGESVESVAEKTGFSEATVYHRVNIAKLDKETVENAMNKRQITLSQFQKLEQIEDIEARNNILKEYGDNIEYGVSRYYNAKKLAEWRETVLAYIKEHDLQPLPEDCPPYAKWVEREAIVVNGEPIPDDEISGLSYYTDYNTSFYFYLVDDVVKDQCQEDTEKALENKKKESEVSKAVEKALNSLRNQLEDFISYLFDKNDDPEDYRAVQYFWQFVAEKGLDAAIDNWVIEDEDESAVIASVPVEYQLAGICYDDWLRYRSSYSFDKCTAEDLNYYINGLIKYFDFEIKEDAEEINKMLSGELFKEGDDE